MLEESWTINEGGIDLVIITSYAPDIVKHTFINMAGGHTANSEFEKCILSSSQASMPELL